MCAPISVLCRAGKQDEETCMNNEVNEPLGTRSGREMTSRPY